MIRTKKLAGSVAAAAEHLSAQLMAPEQPFHAAMPPSQCLQEAPETELSRAAQRDLPSTELSLRAPTSRLQNVNQQSRQPQNGVKPEISNCSTALHVIKAELACFMAVFHVWSDNCTGRLYHSYTREWQTGAPAHCCSIYCTSVTR